MLYFKYLFVSILILISFFLGFSFRGKCEMYASAEDHWAEFHSSVEGVHTLSEEDLAAGIKHPSFKLNYHLNRLEDLNELHYQQFVFPEFSRRSFPLEFLNEDNLKDIGVVWAILSYEIESLGDGFPDDPVCLNLWFLPESRERVTHYVKDLFLQLRASGEFSTDTGGRDETTRKEGSGEKGRVKRRI